MIMNIACGSLQNFRFEGVPYRIIEAGMDHTGQPHARIEPPNTTFHDFLLAHIQEHQEIAYGTVVYPECFECFAGHEEHEKQLFLKQGANRVT